jgi:transcription elongation factor GreA
MEKKMIQEEHIPLTSAGRQRIEEEIARVDARLAELRELIAEAHDDRSADDDEKADAFAMLDELGRQEAKKLHLQAILDRAVDAAPAEADVVDIGTVVRVRDADGEETVYTVVNAAEAEPGRGRVSTGAPLGRALVGHRAGEKVTVDAPSGAWELDILEVGLAA